MLKEFKEFALKGNVLDMAIGVIIGGAFQKIITSLVEDIIMPLITIFTGKVDFSELYITIGNTQVKYGSFITAVIDFLIVAFTLFMVIRSVNKVNEKAKVDMKKIMKKNKKGGKEEVVAKEPTTKICPYCFSEVNYHATKCPHCTSDLKVEAVKEEIVEEK